MKITGLNHAEVLAALYNSARVQGMGFLQADNKKMTTNEAQAILDESSDKYFDYLKGRVVKIKIAGDEIDTRLYNRDNGDGAAERIISKLSTASASL
jgi:hypothetical protein